MAESGDRQGADEATGAGVERTAGGGAAGGSAAAAGQGSGMAGLAALTVPRRGAATGPVPLPTTRRGMLRYRLLPRSVMGISMMILSFAIGAGFSGVVLYSYYQYKQNLSDNKVNALINGYKDEFAKAQAQLDAGAASAKSDIQQQLKAAQALQIGTAQLAGLVKQIAPSVFFVHTLDAAGQPSVGSAFAVASANGQTLLLTSYATIEAATHAPAPQIFVQQGSTSTPVTVRAWDQPNDLALLVLAKTGIPTVQAAPSSPAQQPGDPVFAVSGLGSAGASLVQGTVVDVSSSGLAVDAGVGNAFQGGPVVNRSGQVVAVASRSYAPQGFTSSGVYFVPYVEAACAKVLTCPNGTLVGSH